MEIEREGEYEIGRSRGGSCEGWKRERGLRERSVDRKKNSGGESRELEVANFLRKVERK